MVFKCWPECWAIRMQKKHEINAQNQSSKTLRFRAAISIVKPKGNQFKYDLWEKEAQLIMLHENQISVFSRNSRLKAACWAGVCHLFFLSFYVTWAVNMQNTVKLKQTFKFLYKSSPMSKAESLKVNMFTRVKTILLCRTRPTLLQRLLHKWILGLQWFSLFPGFSICHVAKQVFLNSFLKTHKSMSQLPGINTRQQHHQTTTYHTGTYCYWKQVFSGTTGT